jgi:hypothetical protein
MMLVIGVPVLFSGKNVVNTSTVLAESMYHVDEAVSVFGGESERTVVVTGLPCSSKFTVGAKAVVYQVEFEAMPPVHAREMVTR